jgi:spore maturation protein SpmA/spore maturation protein SpmB
VNVVWIGLLAVGVAFAALTGRLSAYTSGVLEQSKAAVELAIGLVGAMALWLGVMKVAEASGLIHLVSKLVYPLTRLLFPGVPKNHPALSAITLNVAANALGLGNAATPFGLKAMEELEKLNSKRGVPTDDQATFVAMNTANVQLVPATVIALRSAAHSKDPTEIVGPTLLATACAMTAAIISARLLAGLGRFKSQFQTAEPKEASAPSADLAEGFTPIAVQPVPWNRRATVSALLVLFASVAVCVLAGVGFAAESPAPTQGFLGALRTLNAAISRAAIPVMLVGIPVFAFSMRVPAYERFVEGAKEGFWLAIRVLPYLVAILAAVGAFRASGAMDWVASTVGPYADRIGLPAEALPMVLVRPLSGSAANGICGSVFANPGLGPDSYVGRLVSVMNGSTETTFYVLAVYFGAVGIRRYRHALVAGLFADLTGFVASIAVVLAVFGR